MMSVLSHKEEQAKVSKAEVCSRLGNIWELGVPGTHYMPSKQGTECVLVTYSCVTNNPKTALYSEFKIWHTATTSPLGN